MNRRAANSRAKNIAASIVSLAATAATAGLAEAATAAVEAVIAARAATVAGEAATAVRAATGAALGQRETAFPAAPNTRASALAATKPANIAAAGNPAKPRLRAKNCQLISQGEPRRLALLSAGNRAHAVSTGSEAIALRAHRNFAGVERGLARRSSVPARSTPEISAYTAPKINALLFE